MTLKRISAGYYEFSQSSVIQYTATKGGTGWNLYKGDDILRGLIDNYNTLKEIKLKLCN